MKNCVAALLAFLFLNAAMAQHASRTSFNDKWKFLLDSTNTYEGVDVNDKEWRVLRLPHDWSIEGKFDPGNPSGVGGGALPGGVGWYRKQFTVPASMNGKQLFIEFDGVYMNSEVFINGKSLGLRPNGYISFQYDLTPHIKFGERNIIAVKVNNLKQPNSRWYSGSGIYRNVWLTALDKSHIRHWGTYIHTTDVTSISAIVNVSTDIEASSNSALQLQTTIYDPTGRKVIDTLMSAAPTSSSQSFLLRNPKLWSIESPVLYKVVTSLKRNGNVIDTYRSTFGVRHFYFDADKGFFLNGKHVKILGVCNHHDLGALGAAINYRALERQLEIMKGMGVNGIRTSHNPPAPELLELADKMGFIVMNEMFDMWKRPKTPFDFSLAWDEWHKKDLEDFVRRDRNHPSVFIWSVGNEIPEQWGEKGDSSGMLISRELVAITKALDTTRPIVTANNEVGPHNQLIQSNAFDLVGFNYNHTKWGSFKKDYPGKKLIITESTSALQTRGYYDLVPWDSVRLWPVRWDIPLNNGNPGNTVSAYDHVRTPWGSTHEESVKELLKYDHVSGMFIWTGFDYLGEPTPYLWPSRSSYFGIVDLAGFPKDVYYMYKSVFTDKPVLHLFPHWNWKKGDSVEVVAYYNNADEVELLLNGKSLGKKSKQGEDLHVRWKVAYQPGTIKAVSRKDGKTILTRQVNTAENAVGLTLKADRKLIRADGKDLVFVTTTIVDAKGNMVPDANHLIKFTVTGAGEIVGVDNGNPTSLESFKGNIHTAMNGLALCIVQSTGKKGEIVIKAASEGMKPVLIKVRAD